MEAYQKILELAADRNLPQLIDIDSEISIDLVRELIDEGYLTGHDASSFNGPAFVDPRITLAGREYLERLRSGSASSSHTGHNTFIDTGGGAYVVGNVRVGGNFTGRDTTQYSDSDSQARSESSTSGSLGEVKRQVLLDRQGLLLDQYRAANRQLDQTLSAVDRVKLEQTVKQLEEELAQVESQLADMNDILSQRPAPSIVGETVMPPVFEEARQYESVPKFSDRKKKFIHPIENDIRDGTRQFTGEQLQKCASSPWDFDRIVLYLYEEYQTRPPYVDRMHHVHQEFEKVRAADDVPSLSPLHYSIRSILRFLQDHTEITSAGKTSVDDFDAVYAYLTNRPELDRGNHVKENLEKIRDLLQRHIQE